MGKGKRKNLSTDYADEHRFKREEEEDLTTKGTEITEGKI